MSRTGPLYSLGKKQAGSALLPLATTPTVPQPLFSHLCTPAENLQLQTPSSGASPCLSAPDPGQSRPPEPTLNCWLPAFTRTMVPGGPACFPWTPTRISPAGTFGRSGPEARMSLFSTSRFFSRKPVGKQSPIPASSDREGRVRGAGRRPPCRLHLPTILASVPPLSTKSCHIHTLQPPQPSIPTPNSLIKLAPHPRGSHSPPLVAVPPPQGPPSPDGLWPPRDFWGVLPFLSPPG